MASKKRRHFPESFKRQSVERVRTSGLPVCRVAEELGVHETVLRRWMARFAEPGRTPASSARRWSAARSTRSRAPIPSDRGRGFHVIAGARSI
jgi:transposase